MGVLIVGVGYIGSKLAEDLLSDGEEVTAIDNFFSTDRKSVDALVSQYGLDLIEGSVTSQTVLNKALKRRKFSVIYWLAAQSSAHPDAAPPRYTERVNLLAPRLLLDAAAERNVPAVVLASSLKVYGPFLSGHVDENSPYGTFTDLAHLSHCYVEKLAEMYVQVHGLRCVAVRLGVTYGLGPVVKHDYRFMTAPNKFCLQAVRGEKLIITPSGMMPTGFIHVADATRALRIAAAHALADRFIAVNAATEVTSPCQIAKMVVEESARIGRQVSIQLPDEASQPPTASLSSRLDAMGFRPSRRLAPTIREMLLYFSERGRCVTSSGGKFPTRS